MSSILFGSISTVADTSELQRQAFNQAFAQHGLDWNWGREEYMSLLAQSGGQDRIAEYARSKGQDVDAKAVHQTKSALFQAAVVAQRLSARPGVVDTIREAKRSGMKLALVTTTSPENVAKLLEALESEVQAGDFDLIVDSTSVDEPKPDPAAYTFALQSLDLKADQCVAIEDNLGGVDAAVAAGLSCVAFPNANTAVHDFGKATARVDKLDFTDLSDHAGAQ